MLGDRPDRQVWHRAAACSGPDERVAVQLEAAAERAARRGGVDVALAALQRAAALSEADAPRARRLLRAAERAWDLGRRQAVSDLVTAVERLALDEHERARLTYGQAMAQGHMALGRPGNIESLVDIAERVREAGDADLALSLAPAVKRRLGWHLRRASGPPPRARR